MSRIETDCFHRMTIDINLGDHVLIGVDAERRIHVWVDKNGLLRFEGPINDKSKNFLVESSGITEEEEMPF